MLVFDESMNDTIVACATAKGESAVAIVRLSGKKAVFIGQKIAPSKHKHISHKLTLCILKGDDGTILDHGMIVYMYEPHSFTGEECVEFHLHGSMAIVDAVIKQCIKLGARLAKAGEFTMRAFLNNRLSLLQVENLSDLLRSRDENERRIASFHLKGHLNDQINTWVDALTSIVSSFRATMDFPEYVTGEGLDDSHVDILLKIKKDLQKMLENSRLSFSSIQKMVLCGAPNVGKSTLLNFLSKENRVLVDKYPGTTRDPIEVQIQLGHPHKKYDLIVCDTAGIRLNTDNYLEKEGMKMTKREIERADILLWLVDPINPIFPDKNKDFVIVVNKIDLINTQKQIELASKIEAHGYDTKHFISVIENKGLEDLEKWIYKKIDCIFDVNEVIIAKERHFLALKDALRAVNQIFIHQKENVALDIIEIELTTMIHALGKILGRDVESNVLEKIFSQFCIGK